MTRIAYLQCPTGIAGDMCLGALVDAGVPVEYLSEQLGRLGISQEYKLWTEQVHRNGQRATKFHVELVGAAGEWVDPDDFTTFDHLVHQSPDKTPLTRAAEPRSPHFGHTHSHEADQEHSQPSDHPHSHGHDHPHGHHLQAHPPTAAASVERDRAHPPVRHLPEIEQLILNAQLPPRAEAWSLAVFRKLAAAEGAVHGMPPDQVHFHEVGATDALVDIIGSCLGFDWLNIDELYCSALPIGGGTIRAAHGRLPVPSPAVLKLFELGQVPILSNGIEREMVTPTGAAIATTLATGFGAPPPMTLHKVGLGAGTRDLPIPNILRLWIGETGSTAPWEGSRTTQTTAKHSPHATPLPAAVEEPQAAPASAHRHPAHAPSSHAQTPALGAIAPGSLETVAVLETQIDDLNPQAIGYVLEQLLEAGALDVFSQAIVMKKSRPGLVLTVICQPTSIAQCEDIIFRETTTLGIRRSLQQRRVLPRVIQSVQTPYGTVRVKLAWANETTAQPSNVQPEYEDCARLARALKLPWREVHRAAVAAWNQHPSEQARSPLSSTPANPSAQSNNLPSSSGV